MRNKGISLIVLVVTIIVMIIIASVIIMTISDTGIIDKAKDAVEESNRSELESAANLALADLMLDPVNRTKTDSQITEAIKTNLGNDAKDYNVEYKNGKVTVSKKEILSASDSFIYTIKIFEDNTTAKVFNALSAEAINTAILSQESVHNWQNISTINYNFTIDFGDNSEVSGPYTSAVGAIEHVYAKAGTYTVRITGVCESIIIDTSVEDTEYAQGHDNCDILSVDSWGETGVKCMALLREGYHEGNPQEKPMFSIATPKAASFTDLLFYAYSGYGYGVSSIPNGFFKNCANLEQVISAFSYSTATEIPEDLFAGCTRLKNTYYLFSYCNGITEIPENLFEDCLNLKYLDNAFARCSNLTVIPEGLITYANNPNMKSFIETFSSCESIAGSAPEYWNIYADNNPIGTSCFGKPPYATQYTNKTAIDAYDTANSTSWGVYNK